MLGAHGVQLGLDGGHQGVSRRGHVLAKLLAQRGIALCGSRPSPLELAADEVLEDQPDGQEDSERDGHGKEVGHGGRPFADGDNGTATV